MSWTVKAELGNQELTLGVGLPLHDALEFHQVLTDHVEMAYRSATIRPSMKRISYWVEDEGEPVLIAAPRDLLPSLTLEAALI